MSSCGAGHPSHAPRCFTLPPAGPLGPRGPGSPTQVQGHIPQHVLSASASCGEAVTSPRSTHGDRGTHGDPATHPSHPHQLLRHVPAGLGHVHGELLPVPHAPPELDLLQVPRPRGVVHGHGQQQVGLVWRGTGC